MDPGIREFLDHMQDGHTPTTAFIDGKPATEVSGGIQRLSDGRFRAFCELPCGCLIARDPVDDKEEANRQSYQMLRDLEAALTEIGARHSPAEIVQ